MAKSNKKYINDPLENRFEGMREILDIIGIIESGASYYKPDSGKSERRSIVSSTLIHNILYQFYSGENEKKTDFNRTIRNAKDYYNKLDNEYFIRGDKKGSRFVRKKDNFEYPEDLKYSQSYQTFLILVIAILNMDGNLHWDALHQLMQISHPIACLTFLGICIEYKIGLNLTYHKDRTKTQLEFREVIPGKIEFRDGHWVLIGWMKKEKNWRLFLLHSILEMKPELDDLKQYRQFPERPDPDMKEFHKHSFGISVLEGVQPTEVLIKVPNEDVRSVKKRRKEGKWEKKDQFWIWKVIAYDIDEIFSYVFRWKGNLEIYGPPEVKKKFDDQLLSFLKPMKKSKKDPNPLKKKSK